VASGTIVHKVCKRGFGLLRGCFWKKSFIPKKPLRVLFFSEFNTSFFSSPSMFGPVDGSYTFHHPRDLNIPVDSPSSGHSGYIIFPSGGGVEVKSFDQIILAVDRGVDKLSTINLLAQIILKSDIQRSPPCLCGARIITGLVSGFRWSTNFALVTGGQI